MLNEQKLSQYVDQLFLYTTEKTNVKPSCHAKADIGSLIEDETGCPSGGLLSAYSVEKVGLGCHGGKVGV